jgi:hypothetical protein
MNTYSFRTPGVFLAIAKKFAGKSHLLRWVLSSLIKAGRFDWGVVISATARTTGEWDLVPRRFIYPTYDPKVIKRVRMVQRANKESRAFIVLDDIVGVLKIDKTIQSLITSARHENITVFVTTQYLKALPPVVRENAETVFLFRQPNRDLILEAWKIWGDCMDKKDWAAVMLNDVVDHRALLIDTRAQSGKAADKYKLIKAPAKYTIHRLVIGDEDEEDGDEEAETNDEY